MPIKNKYPHTEDGVLSYITDNRGIRYQCSGLARVFKVKSSEMRKTLDALLKIDMPIHSNVVGKYRYYFLPTWAEIALAARTCQATEFKPLKGYEQAMRAFADAAAKGR